MPLFYQKSAIQSEIVKRLFLDKSYGFDAEVAEFVVALFPGVGGIDFALGFKSNGKLLLFSRTSLIHCLKKMDEASCDFTRFNF